MKKRIMLAMAVIMVLGSVKAAMASDERLTDETMIENDLSKVDTAEEEMMLKQIREKITQLDEKTQDFDEVKVGNSIVSAGQAIFAANADHDKLSKSFDRAAALEVSKILDDSLKSLEKHK